MLIGKKHKCSVGYNCIAIGKSKERRVKVMQDPKVKKKSWEKGCHENYWLYKVEDKTSILY